METYTSTCHCTAIRLSFKIPSLTTNSTKITQCNCSICTKNGYLLVYPRTTDVTFHSGESEMAQYRFGNLAKPHKFCARCGTSVLIDFGESLFERERGKVAVNIRTVEGIEDLLPELEYRYFDGKRKLGPPYSVSSSTSVSSV